MAWTFIDSVGARSASATRAKVPRRVSSEKQILQELVIQPGFPFHFGENWDALLDMLRDLSWLPDGEVEIVLRELPPLRGEDLLKYLRVLGQANRDWESVSPGHLRILFPTDFEQVIGEILAMNSTHIRNTQALNSVPAIRNRAFWEFLVCVELG